jgi:hypothetical protein
MPTWDEGEGLVDHGVLRWRYLSLRWLDRIVD